MMIIRMETAQYPQRNWERSSGPSVRVYDSRNNLAEQKHVSHLLGLNPGQDEIDEMIEETDRDNSGAIDFRLLIIRKSDISICKDHITN